MWFLYQAATLSFLLVGGPILLARRGAHYRETLRGRLGGGAELGPKRYDLWIHAVSVGEVAVAATLLSRLPRERSVLVTTTTPTGQARARQLLGDRAGLAYLPFDLDPCLRRFWRRHRADLLVLVEGEAWPLLLHRARSIGVRTALINGRLSDRSFARLSRVPRIARWVFRDIERLGVQTEVDARRWQALGVEDDRLQVTGNLKFESPEPNRDAQLEASLSRIAGDRPILVAGSTMEGEDALVAEAFRAAGGCGRALLLLAPRHPERFDSAERALQDAGLTILRRSRLPEPAAVHVLDDRNPDVVLLDSVGELAGLYRLARGAFVGGTLAPSGGHNPLEPARFGAAVVVGPSMYNFREIADQFDRRSAWARVENAEELAATWRIWIEREHVARDLGASAKALVASHGGALRRTLDLLAGLQSDSATRER